MFDIVKIRKVELYKRHVLVEGTTHIEIGEWYIGGDIQRGCIEDGIWVTIPFDSNIESRVVDGNGEQICYVTVPNDFGLVCIALVQDLTDATVAVTPVYVAGYDVKRFRTYCCKKDLSGQE